MPEFQDQPGASADRGGERFLICTVLEEYYALPSRFISEIALFDKVYPLPLLPNYVLGIINRYSAPFALLDISLLISGQPGPRSKVLVLKAPEGSDPANLEKTALLIGDVLDIVEVPPSEVLPVEKGGPEALVESSFSWKGRNVLVLDVQGLISRAAGEIAA
ncbi:MAG: chemotaxis protein CheW [Treponema sp.]|nr:chemotaxis protein CheW [Treponema sp.]